MKVNFRGPARVMLLLGALTAIATIQDTKNPFELPTHETPEPGKIGEVAVINDAANLISLELLGDWVLDSDLLHRLQPDRKAGILRSLKFTRNEKIERQVIAAVEDARLSLDDSTWCREFREAVRRVYMVGAVDIEAKANHTMGYALVVWRGNPMLLLASGASFRECAHVMIARDPAGDNDILFVGGDKTREPFHPLVRTK